MELLDKLIRIRKDRKIDQKHLLTYLGVSATTMSRYESKKREMPFSIMIKYADYLGYEFRLMIK